MKMVLRGLAFPMMLVVKTICALGRLLLDVASYVIGLVLLTIAGCSIYCIVQAMWTSLVVLVGVGLAAILGIFLLAWGVVKVETVEKNIKTLFT